MKKILLIVSLIFPAILVANSASVLNEKSNNPIISWSPEFIEEKISPGETSEINFVFENKQDLQNIELWLTPELKDFVIVTFTPQYFDSIPANTKNFVRLKISVPVETSLGIYNGTLHMRAGKRTIPQTLKIILKVIEPISEENLTLMLETQKEAVQNFNEWIGLYGREESRRMTVNWLRTQTNIQETGISNDGTIWILFANGIEGDIETYPPETLGGEGGSDLFSQSGIQKIINKINAAVLSGSIIQSLGILNQPIVVGNERAIVLDPFSDELDEASPQSYVYSKISPLTDATYLKNEEVTIDITKTLYEYGVVNITTHGRLHRDIVGFLSGEKVTPINIFSHLGDLRNKRLSIGWHSLTPYYEILPSFITNYAKKPYPQSLIYIGACQSLKNTTMADAFLSRGSATYFGFTKTVSALFNKEKAGELFTNLIDKHQTTEEAFTNGLDPYWPGPNPEYGYEFEPAKFKMVGEPNLILLLAPPQWSLPVNISNNIGISVFPDITSDIFGYLHLVWVDNTLGNFEIFYSMWDGTNWSEPLNISNTPEISNHPAISPDIFGRVHVVWEERVTPQNTEIFYITKDITWSSPVNISNTLGYSSNPDIIADNLGYPHIVWNDQPITPAHTVIFYTKKYEGGWISPINISKKLWGHSIYPAIALDNFQYPYVVWQDDDAQEIFYTTWNGIYWFFPINISKTSEYSGKPDIVAVFNNLHVIWTEIPPLLKSEIFYASKKEGEDWSLPINISNTLGASGFSSLASDDLGYPHVVWNDYAFENGEIFYSRLDEIGWLSPINVSNNPSYSRWPAITFANSRPHIVWDEMISPNNWEIFYSSK